MTRITINIDGNPPGSGVRYVGDPDYTPIEDPVTGTPPVAVDDAFAAVTAGTGPHILNVLANDTGADSIVSADVDVGTVEVVQDATRLSYTPPPSVENDTPVEITYTTQNADGQATATATLTVQPEPEPGVQTVTIETDRTNAVNTATAGFMFKATASGFGNTDPKELRFKWNFGDGDAIVMTALRDERFERFGWRDSNVAYLDTSIHTFAPTKERFNGAATFSYAVSCTVTDKNGNQATGWLTVTVDNPDVTYSGSKTKIVAPDGEFEDMLAEHPGAETFTDINAAYSAGGSQVRILAKRGFTYAVSGSWGAKNSIHIDAWGVGTPPLYDTIAGERPHAEDAVEFSIANSDITGDWDDVTESSPSGTVVNTAFYLGGAFVETYHTFHNVGIRNMGAVMQIAGNPLRVVDGNQKRHVYMGNVALDNFRDYGMLIGTHYRFGAQGLAYRRSRNAAQGGRKDKDANAHTTIRFTGPTEVSWTVIDGYDGYATSGWTRTNSYETTGLGSPGSKGIPASQSNMRWNPGDASLGEAFPSPLKMSRFIAEGGNGILIGSVSYNPELTYGDIALDKGILIAGSTSANCLGFGHKGAWVSNVLGIVPKMKFSRAGDFSDVLSAEGNADHPSRVWGCGVIAWTDPVADRHEATVGNPVDLKGFPPDGANARVMGNWYHAPNMLTPIDISDDLDLSERMFEPWWPGMRFYLWSDSHVRGPLYTNTDYAALDTFTQDGATQASVVLPKPIGTGLLAASADVVPVDDMFGSIRRNDPAGIFRGPVQPMSVAA